MAKIRYRCPICMENKLHFVNKTGWDEKEQRFVCSLEGEVYCETCGYEGVPEKVDLETKDILGSTSTELKVRFSN